MNRTFQRAAVCAAVAVTGAVSTLLLAHVRFFELMQLKAQDAHFVVRGPRPVSNIAIITIDNKSLGNFSELLAFWHRHYADAIQAAADAGAKVFVLDVTFTIPVEKYVPDNDRILAETVASVSPKMPVICAYVPAAMGDQKEAAFAVPLNIVASAMGLAGFANLSADSDDFVRRQELIEAPKAGVPDEQLARGMALRAAEKYFGADAKWHGRNLDLAGREIPLDDDRMMRINYAGPPDMKTFPHISLYDFIEAAKTGNHAQLEKWVRGKVVLLGPDFPGDQDRHATPFYTLFAGDQWKSSGVEIHANVLNTILTHQFLRPIPEWARELALLIAAALCVMVAVSLRPWPTVGWSLATVAALLVSTHLLFREGWLLSTSEMLTSWGIALVGAVIYRFGTAEEKSRFFRSAVALFVGKEVAKDLDRSNRIGLTGQRCMVTILFTDIRGFTAFCESKDPAEVVALLNTYMSRMVAIIVAYHGHVNKFIGDGILAVFSDDNEGASPGDHARRAVACATEMVSEVVGEFKTGAGLHSGEVVIGNVGSTDKMEFTVLGDTVNLASRLESLNKEHKTKLLMSEETREMLDGSIDTIFLGSVAVRGKTAPMKLYTVTAVAPESAKARHLAEASI